MTVGFFHQGESEIHEALAARLVASTRSAMPDVEVVHFVGAGPKMLTDSALYVPDLSNRIALACLQAYSNCKGDWLFVDTDVEVRSDVRHVFDDPDFDVAVATREGTYSDERDQRWSEKHGMPVNKGAVFSRCQAFWQATVDHLRTLKPELQRWMGDQIAVNHVIASGRFKVKVLPNAYNYPPKWKFEDLNGKHIIHWKGPRKKWALELAAERVA